MHECWQFLIGMMIWKILLSVQLEEKCIYMGSISKPNWGFNQANGNF